MHYLAYKKEKIFSGKVGVFEIVCFCKNANKTLIVRNKDQELALKIWQIIKCFTI